MKNSFLNKDTLTVIGGTLLVLRNEILSLGDIDFVAYLTLLRAETASDGGSLTRLRCELPVSEEILEGAIHYLTDNELVYKERDEADRRSYTLRCTPQGSNLVHSIDPALTGSLQSYWHFSEEDLLSDFISAFKPFGNIPPNTLPLLHVDVPYSSIVGVARLWSELIDCSHEAALSTAESHILYLLDGQGSIDFDDLLRRTYLMPTSLRAVLLNAQAKGLVSLQEHATPGDGRGGPTSVTIMQKGEHRLVDLGEIIRLHARGGEDATRRNGPHLPYSTHGRVSATLHQVCLLVYRQFVIGNARR